MCVRDRGRGGWERKLDERGGRKVDEGENWMKGGEGRTARGERFRVKKLYGGAKCDAFFGVFTSLLL